MMIRTVEVSPASNQIAYWTTSADGKTGIAWLYDIDTDKTHKLKQIVSPESVFVNILLNIYKVDVLFSKPS